MSDQLQQPVTEKMSLLDGAWFRKERLRIAIGRLPIAQKLQVPESRIATLETRQRPVPEAWLPVLAGFGFQLPPETVPALQAETPEAETPEAEAPEAEAPEAEALEVEALKAEAPEVEDRPAAAVVTPAPEPAPDRPATPSPEGATAPSAPELLRGGWLRERRYALNLSLRRLALEVGLLPNYLKLVEGHNLVLPRAWLPVLIKLRLCTQAEPASPAAALLHETVNGAWLRAQRQRLGMTTERLSQRLRVRLAVMQLIEARAWPVLPEWLPPLRQLGFQVPKSEVAASPSPEPAPAPAPALAAPSAASTKEPTELLELVLGYRTTLGRRTGASAAQVLAWAAQDLCLAGAELGPGYEQVEAALRGLYRGR